MNYKIQFHNLDKTKPPHYITYSKAHDGTVEIDGKKYKFECFEFYQSETRRRSYIIEYQERPKINVYEIEQSIKKQLNEFYLSGKATEILPDIAPKTKLIPEVKVKKKDGRGRPPMDPILKARREMEKMNKPKGKRGRPKKL